MLLAKDAHVWEQRVQQLAEGWGQKLAQVSEQGVQQVAHAWEQREGHRLEAAQREASQICIPAYFPCLTSELVRLCGAGRPGGRR